MASLLTIPYELTIKTGIRAMEMNLMPDFVLRRACRALMSMRIRISRKHSVEEQQRDLMAFVESLRTMPIAINTEAANEQHYEVPTEFYKLCLGKRLKYSACYFPKPTASLDEAEEATLQLYCDRAELAGGQDVLELGCGWGSLSLFMAARFPSSRITAVSNSATQKAHIMEECRKQGLTNLEVITADMNVFTAPRQYDRVVSVEMLEHMKNYQKLLQRVATWMKPEALLFIHIFAHKEFAYHFEVRGDDDWLSKYFFTGGTMPADSLLLYFQDDVAVVNHWRLNGKHYQLTSEAWLRRFDANVRKIRPILAETYGPEQATRWTVYWRTFFIAVAELFGYDNGEEWIISHYLFRKK